MQHVSMHLHMWTVSLMEQEYEVVNIWSIKFSKREVDLSGKVKIMFIFIHVCTLMYTLYIGYTE